MRSPSQSFRWLSKLPSSLEAVIALHDHIWWVISNLKLLVSPTFAKLHLYSQGHLVFKCLTTTSTFQVSKGCERLASHQALYSKGRWWKNRLLLSFISTQCGGFAHQATAHLKATHWIFGLVDVHGNNCQDGTQMIFHSALFFRCRLSASLRSTSSEGFFNSSSFLLMANICISRYG